MAALLDLPLACEDRAPDPAAVLAKADKDISIGTDRGTGKDLDVATSPVAWNNHGESIMEAMRALGLQRILFMLTVLILEEVPFPLLLLPGL